MDVLDPMLTLAPRKNEAIEEAKEAIDRALSEVGKPN
jgi:hypothetical protein